VCGLSGQKGLQLPPCLYEGYFLREPGNQELGALQRVGNVLGMPSFRPSLLFIYLRQGKQRSISLRSISTTTTIVIIGEFGKISRASVAHMQTPSPGALGRVLQIKRISL
jgi:hypothetical protein